VAGLSVKSFLPRFLIGLAGALAAGFVVFRWQALNPAALPFQCITVGALTAAMLTLVRISRHGAALLLVVAFGLARYGFAGSVGWLPGISGFLLAAGIYLVAVIFDLLARGGLVLGKFLLVGPLIGGIYLALTPFTDFYTLTSDDVTRTLMLRFLVGMILGDGAGLGVELADLPAAAAAARRRAAEADEEQSE
jgi:hypothetical protein